MLFAVPRSLTKGLHNKADHLAYTDAAVQALDDPAVKPGLAVLEEQAPDSLDTLQSALSSRMQGRSIRGALKDLDSACLEVVRAGAATSRTFKRCGQQVLDEVAIDALQTPIVVTAVDSAASTHKHDIMYAIELLGLQAHQGENGFRFEPGKNPAKGLNPSSPVDCLTDAAAIVAQGKTYQPVRDKLGEQLPDTLDTLQQAAAGHTTDGATLFAALQATYGAQLDDMRQRILASTRFRTLRRSCPLDTAALAQPQDLSSRSWHDAVRKLAQWVNEQPDPTRLEPPYRVFHIAPRYTDHMPDDVSTQRAKALARRGMLDPRGTRGRQSMERLYDKLWGYLVDPDSGVPHNIRVALRRLEVINTEMLRQGLLGSKEFGELSGHVEPAAMDLLREELNLSSHSDETKSQVRLIVDMARWVNEVHAD